MRIQHNLSAMNSLSNYHGNNSTLSGNLEKLSSGYRINSAADDAAGLAISEKMRSQIAGLNKAQDNANDGISLIQTAEGALKEVNSMLTRLTTLATQSANGTYDKGVDRANLQEEADALLSEIDRISQSTNFNGINLLDGSMSAGGVKGTEAAINVNGIAMNASSSTEGIGPEYALSLSQEDGVEVGQSQTFKFSYTDETGNDKVGSVTFESGIDSVATTKNLAEAINNDASLGSHFIASVNDKNELIIDSNTKAAAAIKGNSTTGGAHIGEITNGNTVGGLTIDKQGAVTTYAKLSDKLYAEDGSELKTSDQIKAAVEGGQKLYTSIDPAGNASVESNTVSQANIELSQAGKNLTTDTTFTLKIGSEIDVTKTSASLQGVSLTEEGKNIQGETTFTYSSASVAETGVTLKNAGLAMTDDVTFTYHSAEIGSMSDGLTAKIDGTAASAGELTSDTTFTYTAAKLDSTSSLRDSSGVELTDKAKALVSDATFTYTAAKDSGATSANLGSVTLTNNAKGLVAKDDSAATLTFTYTSASLDTNSSNTLQGASISTVTLTSAAISLTDDTTFSYDGNSWTMTNERTGESKNVTISTYISATNIDTTGTKDDTIHLKAGYWKADANAVAAGVSGKEIENDNTGAVNIGDGSAYFSFTEKGKLNGGETITLDSGKWEATSDDTTVMALGTSGSDIYADDIKQYFSGSGATSDNETVVIKAGEWKSSNVNLGAAKNGTLTSAEAQNYIGNITATGATEDGQTIVVSAKHWQANDSTYGDNGNIGDTNKYFSLSATATSGQTVTITGGQWDASGAINENDVDINKYFEGADSEYRNGAQVSVKSSGEWTMTTATNPEGEVVDIGDYINTDLSNVNVLTEGSITVKASEFTFPEDSEAVEGEDYQASEDVTATKTYDLSGLNDGDKIQINGSNYTYRANEKDVTNATDFHTGSQLAAMSQAISVSKDADENGNGLDKIVVSDQFEEGSALSLQVGDTNQDYQKVSVDIRDMSATGLGLKGIDISTQEGAGAAIDTIKTAVNAVSTQRGKLGALQNRLDHTLNSLDATTQNITAAESQIRDTDMAKEMTEYSKNNILAQAAQSMLAQANSMPQGVLSLLG